MRVPKILQTISKILRKQNAKAIIVGGSVRDYFLGLPIKDYDIEVYGLKSMEQLEEILKVYGSVNLVGKSFGVLKFSHESEEYDFSFPRKEQKMGTGHRGFDVQVDGSLHFEEAAKRRDFTINAMGYEIESGRLVNPYGGKADIEKKVLRYIDEKTFKEDPLRVYRAVQFSARFGFELAKETKILCQRMVKEGMLEELPKERVYVEFTKLLLKSPKPSIGFELMRELGILHYFPELQAIIGVPQSPKQHPEGDVWVHTMMSVDAMAEQVAGSREQGAERIDEKQRLKYMFAILCHDLGKATTTSIDKDGNIRAIGHEQAGVELARSFMYRLTDEHNFIESILPLVEHHLKPSQFYSAGAKSAAVRRLAAKVNIEELVLVAKADFLGRTTKKALAGDYKAGEWLLEKAKALGVQSKPLENLLQGRDLINLGLEPSPQFKTILEKVYELQIDGVLSTKEEALVYVKSRMKNE